MKTITPFGSRSLMAHLLRGVLGITTLIFAFKFSDVFPLLAMGLGLSTLIAFRGCPVCWTIGLVEFLNIKFKDKI